MNSSRALHRMMAGFALLLALGLVAPAAAPPPRLPSFAGWQKIRSAIALPPSSGLPPDQAPILAEFGLLSVERDAYQRADRTIQVEGFRFSDAGGAYGAFTYFRPADFRAFDLEQPHDQAESDGTHILFTRGSWLIRVTMDQLTAMTAAEMRQLAVRLSPTSGASLLPTLPYYLPRPHLLASSVRYVEGPAGFSAACAWLPASSVGFNMGAEAVVAAYDLNQDAGGTQLAILSYPTPQIARAHLDALSRDAALAVRRTGPLLVLLHGPHGPDADQLLQSVNYDADVTLVPPSPVGIDALPSLILSIFVLCGLIITVSVVVGLLSGGLRVLMDRALPQRFRKSQTESIIRLHLE